MKPFKKGIRKGLYWNEKNCIHFTYPVTHFWMFAVSIESSSNCIFWFPIFKSWRHPLKPFKLLIIDLMTSSEPFVKLNIVGTSVITPPMNILPEPK